MYQRQYYILGLDLAVLLAQGYQRIIRSSTLLSFENNNFFFPRYFNHHVAWPYLSIFSSPFVNRSARMMNWFRETLSDIKKHRNAYILTIFASFGGMLFGWDTGLIGGILTMESFKKSFALSNKTSEEQKAFSNISGNIVSVLQAGCFFGAMSSFFLSHYFGRKIALLIGSFIFLVGSTVQTCSGVNTTSLTLLYIGRVIGGLGVGLISAIVPTYIGENTHKEIRGRCVGTMQLFNCTGIMISFFINYGIVNSSFAESSLEWRIPFALQMIPGVLLIGLVTQNESPRWLVMNCRITEAHIALRRVRGESIDESEILKELDEIEADLQGHKELSLLEQVMIACENRKIFYRVSIGTTLMFWQQWTGTNAINYYAPQIFSSIGLKGHKTELFATGIYGIVKVIMTFLSLLLATEQIGRKYSLMISSAGQAFSMFFIGIQTASNTSSQGAQVSGLGIFAILCIYLFVVFFSLGWGMIPYILAAEISPNHLRSLSMSLSLMMQWLVNFVIARVLPVMLDRINAGTFLFFGGSSVMCFLYSVLCVPETSGVPLEKIHLLFENNFLKGAFLDTFPHSRRSKKLASTAYGVRNGRDNEDRCMEPESILKFASNLDENLSINTKKAPSQSIAHDA